ncbi:MAG: anthranilate synthase component I [Parvibaculales bacterium]
MSELTPPFDEFEKAYQRGETQLVYANIIADLETPVSAYLKLCQDRKYSFLLESVQDGDVKGRFSIIGWAPDLIYKVDAGEVFINRTALENDTFEPFKIAPLDGLRHVLAESEINIPDSLPPMASGVFGYMSYDMVRQMEKLPDTNPAALDTPDSLFMRPTMIAVFDTVTNSLIMVTPVRPTDTQSAHDAYQQAQARIAAARTALSAPLKETLTKPETDFTPPSSNMSQTAYHNMVARAKEYIKAGDIFQVVLSQCFETAFPLPPFELYRSLRRINPSPYLFFLNFDGFSVIGSSPEVLVGVSDKTVNIRPIAGTRRRGATPAQDKEIGAELLADEKELAEHLMLLDLGRNDIGRVSKIGTVQVNESFSLQKTSHLIHIYSDLTGTLDEGLDNIDALAAGFPAGTVSGAPKVRAMEIIDELEPQKRGIYSGCVGYFSAGGDMDTCIVLRTGIIKDNVLYVQAGGGVVYDSTEEGEYNETVNKAMALFRAAEDAFEQAKNATQ